MARTWILIGSIAGGLGVAGGAFGAHALQSRLPTDLLAHFETGTRYLLIHAVALLVVGLLTQRSDARSLRLAGGAFSFGILVFTGTLWVLAISGMRWLGAITPIGGTALIVGWVALAVAAAKGHLEPQ